MALRRDTKRCPLCGVALTDTPYLPNSKELDHIVPLNAGGTHTIGNVRIICREGNLARPRDGSDYTGPVTLWAQTPGFIAARAAPIPVSAGPMECHCGLLLLAGRCWTCAPPKEPKPERPIPTCFRCGRDTRTGKPGRPRVLCLDCYGELQTEAPWLSHSVAVNRSRAALTQRDD